MIYSPEQLDTKPTEEILASAIGDCALRDLETRHPATYRHQLRVGELCRLTLNEQGFKDVATVGALSGGFHDVGKLLSSEILELITSPRTLTPQERLRVSGHSWLGGEWISRLATEHPAGSDLSRQLSTAAFVAANHHNRRILPSYDTGDSFNSGLTRVVAAFDVFDALVDPDRNYRKEPFSPERVCAVVQRVIGNNQPKLPVGEGFAGVDVDTTIKYLAGL